MRSNIQYFFDEQLKTWDFACNNYNALKFSKMKEFSVNGCEYKVQFNPARIASTEAKVDAKSIQERNCFLCEKNLPKEQIKIAFKDKYSIMVNPFPIFPNHFTISQNSHVQQTILSRFADMIDIAEYMNDFVIFYNGPKCGASAPDHAHFQAGNKSFLPLEMNWEKHIASKITDNLYHVNYGFHYLMINTENREKAVSIFEKIYGSLKINDGESEPLMNVLVWFESSINRGFTVAIIPRAKHRPYCFFEKGDKNIMISPASVDLGGVFITPFEKDFEKITEKEIANILNEVCLNQNEFQQLIVNLGRN